MKVVGSEICRSFLKPNLISSVLEKICLPYAFLSTSISTSPNGATRWSFAELAIKIIPAHVPKIGFDSLNSLIGSRNLNLSIKIDIAVDSPPGKTRPSTSFSRAPF